MTKSNFVTLPNQYAESFSAWDALRNVEYPDYLKLNSAFLNMQSVQDKIINIVSDIVQDDTCDLASEHAPVTATKVKHAVRLVNSFKKEQKRMREVDEYPHLFGVGPYVEENDKGKYLKQRKNSTCKQFYKRVSNKKMRNSREGYNSRQKGHYRKKFDYKWTIS